MTNTRSTCLILSLLFLFTAVAFCETRSGATLRGIFVDAENGQPIPDVLVRADAEKIARVYPDREFQHATATDTKGTFSLTIPNDPQTYYAFSFMALHPKYQAKRLRHKMTPQKSEYNLGKIALKRTLSLKGNVSGEQNLAGLIVNLKMHAKSADFFRAAAPIEHAAKTDTTGNFNFSELYPIEYTLTISRNDVIMDYVAAINPQKQPEIAIRLSKLETLRGTVVDAQAHPIAGARLYATRHAETPHGHTAILAAAQTDETGNFQMHVLETEPHLLSLQVSKSGYFSRIYENVDIEQMPPMIPLEKGVTVKGRVSLPQDLPAEAQFTVTVFRAGTQMEPSLNPLALHKPLLSKYFPVTESAFVIEGLFAEKYILYISGDGISATSINIDASTNAGELLIVADRPAATLQGQVLWADTGEPVHNAIVSRSWYPWELHPSDMSMTLDRFAVETDAHGKFKFANLTEARYQLHIRAVHAVLKGTEEHYQRTRVHKQVAVPNTGTAYRIYLGRRDGTPFTNHLK